MAYNNDVMKVDKIIPVNSINWAWKIYIDNLIMLGLHLERCFKI
jgi:hypothetical protein